MKQTKPKWISVYRMGKSLSVPTHEAYRIANSGSLETVKIGSCLRINEYSLIRWLESLRQPRTQGVI